MHMYEDLRNHDQYEVVSIQPLLEVGLDRELCEMLPHTKHLAELENIKATWALFTSRREKQTCKHLSQMKVPPYPAQTSSLEGRHASVSSLTRE